MRSFPEPGADGAATARLRFALIVAVAMALAAFVQPPAARGDVRELDWEELMPEDWDPVSRIEFLLGDDIENLSDDSTEARRLMDAYMESIRDAPVVAELDGQEVRIPGFVVPLDFSGTQTTEFLLVPYFGACIHTPPPPANQIVYVTTGAGYALKELFDAVWVTGVISTTAHLNDIGDAGYTLRATIVEPY